MQRGRVGEPAVARLLRVRVEVRVGAGVRVGRCPPGRVRVRVRVEIRVRVEVGVRVGVRGRVRVSYSPMRKSSVGFVGHTTTTTLSKSSTWYGPNGRAFA